MSTQFSSIWTIARILSGATTAGQSGPESDENEVVLCIARSSGITGASPSDCLVSHPGHPLEGSYPSAEMQSVYSTVPTDWEMVLYRHLQHHNDAMNNRRAKNSLTKNLPLTLLQGFEKGYSRFVCERELETEQNWNILNPTIMALKVVSFSFSWCSTGGPGVHSARCWLSLLHLISNFSGPQTPSGVPEGPLGRVWLSLPHLVYKSVSNCNCNCHLTSVLTELYNSSTPTRSPTRSLEWHDWSDIQRK